MSLASILRMLVVQALQLDHSPLTQTPNPLTSTHFGSAVSDMDWIRLLNLSLSTLPQIFIVIDAALIAAATGNSTYRATRWLQTLLETVEETSVKLFVKSNAVDVDYISRSWEDGMWSRVSAVAISEKRGTPRRRKARHIHRRRIGMSSR